MPQIAFQVRPAPHRRVIHLKLTAGEADSIRAAAYTCDMTQSGWLRMVTLAAAGCASSEGGTIPEDMEETLLEAATEAGMYLTTWVRLIALQTADAGGPLLLHLRGARARHSVYLIDGT